MTDFAQTQNTGNLQKFIKEIPNRGVPDKVTIKHLEGIGFASKNDRTIMTVLKFIGVLESNGVPSESYKRLRNKQTAPKELAELIRKSYASLFKTYPDAHTKDVEQLKTWFSSHTSVGAASVRNMAQTFNALCTLADFNGTYAAEETDENTDDNETITTKRKSPSRRSQDAQIAFNIQIQIPGEQPPEVYDAIFRNLGKYVLGIVDDDE